MTEEILLENNTPDFSIMLLLENAKSIWHMIQTNNINKMNIFMMGEKPFEEAIFFLKENNFIEHNFNLELNWQPISHEDLFIMNNLHSLITENRGNDYQLFLGEKKNITIQCLQLLHNTHILSIKDIIRWLSHEEQYEVLCEFISQQAKEIEKEPELELLKLSSLYGGEIFRSQIRNHIMHINLENSLNKFTPLEKNISRTKI